MIGSCGRRLSASWRPSQFRARRSERCEPPRRVRRDASHRTGVAGRSGTDAAIRRSSSREIVASAGVGCAERKALPPRRGCRAKRGLRGAAPRSGRRPGRSVAQASCGRRDRAVSSSQRCGPRDSPRLVAGSRTKASSPGDLQRNESDRPSSVAVALGAQRGRRCSDPHAVGGSRPGCRSHRRKAARAKSRRTRGEAPRFGVPGRAGSGTKEAVGTQESRDALDDGLDLLRAALRVDGR